MKKNIMAIENGKKRIEFSKIIVVFVLIWCMTLVTFSFILASMDKNVNEGVTIAIITSLITTLLGYFIYQAKLKISRDKYKVDKDGVPFELEEEEDEETKPLE